MDTKNQIQAKIDNLEEAAKLILEEIINLKSFLEVTYIGENKKEVSVENYERIGFRITPNSFITFTLPETNSFNELVFEESKIMDVTNDDDDGNILDLRKTRDDRAEYSYFGELTRYFNSLVNKPIRSRYQVADLFEAGLHTETPLSVAEAHLKKEKIKNLMPSPYFARIDLTSYSEDKKQTFYIGYDGFDGDGRDEFSINSWTTNIGRLFEKKESIFNKIIDDRKMGKVKLTFARNIEINKGEIIKLHKPFGETIYNEALINKLASKHGIDMEAIVETIEAEQSEVIRQPIRAGETIIIQGSAGSGKSAIALQRISYLLTEYRDIIKREDSIAFFGPNELFLKHISRVLPRLGTYKVKQTTFLNYLKEIVSVKHTIPVSDERYITFKGSIEYKKFIEFQTNSLLNNLIPWNKEFYISDNERVTAVEIIQIIDNSLQFPYKERKSIIIHHIDQKLKESQKNNQDIITSIENKMEAFITQEIKDLLRKVCGQDKGQLSSILSENTIRILEIYESQVKRDKKKKSPDIFYFSPLTSEARKIKDVLQVLLAEDFKKIINKFTNLYNQSFLVFDSQIYSLLQPFIDGYVEKKKQVYISKRLSEHLGYIYQYLVTPFKEVLESKEIQSIILKADQEFLQYYSTHSKEEIQGVFQEILDKFEDLWNYAFEDELKKLISKIFMESSVEIIFGNRLFDKPSKKQIPIEDTSLIRTRIEKFVDSRWLNSPEEVYRKILKNPYNLIEKYESVDIKKNISYLKQEDTLHDIDLPALFSIYLIMRGNLEDSKKLNYLIVDEVQDYLQYELWCLTQLSKRNSMMLLGDLGQNLNKYNKLDNWESYSKILGNVSFYNLKKTYRSTKQIVDYSNRIIEPYSKGKFELPNTIFREGPLVKEKKISKENKRDSILKTIKELELADDSYETIAILCHDQSEAKEIYDVLSIQIDTLHWQKSYDDSIRTKYIVSEVRLVKGLEFDCVIIPDISLYLNNDFDRRLAYVGVSRALHELHVLYNERIPFFE